MHKLLDPLLYHFTDICFGSILLTKKAYSYIINLSKIASGRSRVDAIQKELESRKSEIKKELELLFNANNRISSWDVPEVNQKEAAQLLLKVMQDALDELKEEILSKYP